MKRVAVLAHWCFAEYRKCGEEVTVDGFADRELPPLFAVAVEGNTRFRERNNALEFQRFEVCCRLRFQELAVEKAIDDRGKGRLLEHPRVLGLPFFFKPVGSCGADPDFHEIDYSPRTASGAPLRGFSLVGAGAR